jgi:hypothetical protein
MSSRHWYRTSVGPLPGCVATGALCRGGAVDGGTHRWGVPGMPVTRGGMRLRGRSRRRGRRRAHRRNGIGLRRRRRRCRLGAGFMGAHLVHLGLEDPSRASQAPRRIREPLSTEQHHHNTNDDQPVCRAQSTHDHRPPFTIENQRPTSEADLDQYQVRDWRAWHAHIHARVTLADAYLAATRAREAEERGSGDLPPCEPGRARPCQIRPCGRARTRLRRVLAHAGQVANSTTDRCSSSTSGTVLGAS